MGVGGRERAGGSGIGKQKAVPVHTLPPAYVRPKLICMAVLPSAAVAMRFTIRRTVKSLTTPWICQSLATKREVKEQCSNMRQSKKETHTHIPDVIIQIGELESPVGLEDDQGDHDH